MSENEEAPIEFSPAPRGTPVPEDQVGWEPTEPEFAKQDFLGNDCPDGCEVDEAHIHQDVRTFNVKQGQHIRIFDECHVAVEDGFRIYGLGTVRCYLHDFSQPETDEGEGFDEN